MTKNDAAFIPKCISSQMLTTLAVRNDCSVLFYSYNKDDFLWPLHIKISRVVCLTNREILHFVSIHSASD